MKNDISEILGYVFMIIGIITTILIILHSLYKSKSLGLFIKSSILGGNLNKSLGKFLDEFPNPSTKSKADIIGDIFHRITRIGVIGLIIAITPSILLFIQNKKIETQNNLITKQNERLKQQTYLQEAERRSSLIFLMSNVLNKMDEELKNETNSDRILSDELMGQISSLSIAFKPYRYLDGDSLTTKLLSPERGQLLLTLINSKLNVRSLHTIYYQGNFQFSDLSNTTITQPHFQAIDLSYSSFKETKLINTTFYETILIDCNFNNAKVEGSTSIGGSDISKSTFLKTEMADRITGDMIKIQDIVIDDEKWLDRYILKKDFNDLFDKSEFALQDLENGTFKLIEKAHNTR